jgi:hypothetical protein
MDLRARIWWYNRIERSSAPSRKTSYIPNLRCAKTSELQFDFVPQESGHEGAVSNAVTTA